MAPRKRAASKSKRRAAPAVVPGTSNVSSDTHDVASSATPRPPMAKRPRLSRVASSSSGAAPQSSQPESPIDRKRQSSRHSVQSHHTSPLLSPESPTAEEEAVSDAGRNDSQAQLDCDTDLDNDEDLVEDEVHQFGPETDSDELGDYDDSSPAGFINLGPLSNLFVDGSDRFTPLLATIQKPDSSPAAQLAALDELATLLSMCQEDMFGSVSLKSLVRTLVLVLGGTPPNEGSTFPAIPLDPELLPERQVLAARCLTNLLDVLPLAGKVVASQGGVLALVSKLRAMETIEMAEPALQALEKISGDDASAVVAQDGLLALLQFLDFLNVHLQRTALATVANCCRSLTPKDLDRVSPAIPLLAQVVTSSDRRLQEMACTAVVRILQSFHTRPDQLANLVTPPLCAALETVLLPETGKPTALPVSIVTDLVRALTLAARAAPPVAQDLRDSGVGETLRAILTGSRQAIDKMLVLQTLSERPVEQIESTLQLARELLPTNVSGSRDTPDRGMERFCTLLTPAFLEVYSACINQSTRDLALTALLQVVTWGNSDQLARMMEALPMAALLSGVLANDQAPNLVRIVLDIAKELLTKLEHIYLSLFQRYGLFGAVRQLVSSPSSAPGGTKQRHLSRQRSKRGKKASHYLTPAQEHIVNLAKVVDRFHTTDQPSETLDRLQALAERLGDSADSQATEKVLDDLLTFAGKAPIGLAAYELVKSSLLDKLLVSVGSGQKTKHVAEVHATWYQSLKKHRMGTVSLINCLQELLMRTDTLQLETLGHALSEEARALPGMEITSQMRLTLIPAEPEEVPRSCRGLVIGIHAVAPLGTVAEFLHSKLHIAETFEAGSARGDRNRRLSSVLAALARPDEQDEQDEQDDGHSHESERGDATRALMEGLAEGAFDEMVVDEDDEDDEGERLWLDHDPAPPDETDEIPILSDGTSETGDKPVPRTAEGVGSSSSGAAAAAEANQRPKRSHAQAVQNASAQNDWHLVFSVGERELDLDETIFSAVYKLMKEKDANFSPDQSFWTTPFPITFRKVKGAVRPQKPEAHADTEKKGLPLQCSSLMKKVLRLLSASHGLLSQHSGDAGELKSLYVSKQLTAKLNRQLLEPLLAASNLLPAWTKDLVKQWPFLFPFATRYALLQASAFGAPRLVARCQAQVPSLGSDSSSATRARDEAFGYLGRLARQKVRIARDRILDSVVKICENYACTSSVLEVEYFDEVGTGLGPTLEFYALASRAFARTDTDMWYTSGTDGEYMSAPHGLFPRPTQKRGARPSAVQKRFQLFRALGTFVAKSLLDSRIIHIHLHPVFWALIREDQVDKSLPTLAQIDPALALSLEKLSALPSEEVEALGMDFTLPGDDAFELIPGGKDKTVTGGNLNEYIELMATAFVENPVVTAFRDGFGQLVDPSALQFFLPSELTEVFGSAPEDWSRVTLASALKPDHGFSHDSSAYQQLIDLMASFTSEERRVFLQWLTGSPKLPIGGFGALQPPLTVVKRPHEPPLTPNDYLPSVMTCANYLKLPDYSSASMLEQRVRKAMHEGSASFHLS